MSTWVITDTIAYDHAIGVVQTTQATDLGTVAKAKDIASTAYGTGYFKYLAIPVSTAIALGILVTWTASDYKVVAVPAGGTSKATGVPVAGTVQAISSNAAVQYAWFQVEGKIPLLKTAVATTANVPIYISGTAGRVKVLVSTTQIILGAMTCEAVTSTTSTALCYLNRSSLPGA